MSAAGAARHARGLSPLPRAQLGGAGDAVGASDAAGANTKFSFDGDVKRVVATRDIAEGDELLQDYRAQALAPDWFEALLATAGLQSARQLAVQLERTAQAHVSGALGGTADCRDVGATSSRGGAGA